MRAPIALVLAAVMLAALVPFASSRAQESAGSLVVIVRGLRSERGIVRGGLYADASRWTHDDGVVARCAARAGPPAGGRADVARCVFETIPGGRYALALFHDEDSDGHYDRDPIGLPQEGYAFGRDARPVLGAPSFESASIRIAGPTTTEVRMRYGI